MIKPVQAILSRWSGPDPATALGAGLGNGGLPVGSPAPEFTLPSPDGERVSLESILAAEESPLLLVFSDSGCGPCQALMPELAGWQSEHAGRLAVAVVAGGDQQGNREKATQHGLQRVLLQSEREVSEAYQASGTPMALVIGRDGLIESPTVGGTEAIRTLVAQATRPVLAVRQVPASDRHRHDVDPSPPVPDTSRVGQPAPELALRELDGELIALTDLYADRTVAIFWNPGCGFCQWMLPDLRALEDDPPEPAPQLVVIATGDPDAVRELQLRSRALLDPDSEAMHAFAAGGTPMGVQIDHGRIASPVAAGADAVFALIHARSPV